MCFEGEETMTRGEAYRLQVKEAYLDGMTDFDDGNVMGFYVSKEDKLIFPELKRRRTVKLYQRDDGFVVEV